MVIIFACLILVAYFVFLTDASLVGKGVVFGLFIVFFVIYSRISPLVGMALLVGLSIFIILYRKWHKLP